MKVTVDLQSIFSFAATQVETGERGKGEETILGERAWMYFTTRRCVCAYAGQAAPSKLTAQHQGVDRRGGQ